MNEFLNQEFLDNTLRQYLITAGIILFAFLAKKYVAHYVASVIFKIIQLRWKTIDRASFKTLLVQPLGLFLAVLIAVIALDKLRFPAMLDFELYRLQLKDILKIIGTAAIIITFFMFLIKCVDFISLAAKDRYLQNDDRSKSQLVFFLKDFIKMLLGLVAILLILKYCFNYDIKGLVTGLSIVGAAVALALKENLENLIASFIIFFDKPFTTGDLVKVNNITGTVEKIGLRSTRIRSDEKTYITVPNKQMSDSILDNLSERTQRRATFKLELSYFTSAEKLQQLLDGLNGIVNRTDILTPNIFVSDLSPSAIVVTVDFFTAPVIFKTFCDTRQDVYLRSLQLLETLDIEAAGRTTDINIRPEDSTPKSGTTAS